MPATKDGFLFNPDRDIDFLRSVHYLRVGTIDHLAALTGRSYPRIQKRAAKLENNGYLIALTRPPRKILYALGREGVAALVHYGYEPAELLERRIRTKELKDIYLRHLMLVKDVQVKLSMLARGTSIEIPRWEEGKQTYDYVTFQEQYGGKSKTVRLSVRPDAVFAVRDTTRPTGKNQISYVLEADRSTERHGYLHDKMKGYVHYLEQKRAPAKWECERFRILFISARADRAHNIRASLINLIPRHISPDFLISTTFEALTLETLLKPPTARLESVVG